MPSRTPAVRDFSLAAAVVSRRYGVRMLSVGGPVLWNVLRGRYADRIEPLLGRPLTALERDAPH